MIQQQHLYEVLWQHKPSIAKTTEQKDRYKQKKTHNLEEQFWILPAFHLKQSQKLKPGIIILIHSHLHNSDLFLIINRKKIKTEQWKNNKTECWSISDTWTFLETSTPKYIAQSEKAQGRHENNAPWSPNFF